jgi:hypothetical protein
MTMDKESLGFLFSHQCCADDADGSMPNLHSASSSDEEGEEGGGAAAAPATTTDAGASADAEPSLLEIRASSDELQDDFLRYLDELAEQEKDLTESIIVEEFEETWAPEIAAEDAEKRQDYMEAVMGLLISFANENGITIDEARPLFHKQMIEEALKTSKLVIRLTGDFNLSVVVGSDSTIDDLKEVLSQLCPPPASVELRFKLPKANPLKVPPNEERDVKEKRSQRREAGGEDREKRAKKGRERGCVCANDNCKFPQFLHLRKIYLLNQVYVYKCLLSSVALMM